MPDFAVATAFTGKGNIVSYMGQAGAAVDKFGNRASSAFKRVNNSGFSLLGMAKSLVPAFGIYQVFNYAKKAIDAWEQQQVAVANVEQGLKSTNNAIGMTSAQLQKMASNWQKVGLFGDETILQNVTAQLLTFGSIGKKNFDAMQGAAMDITTKLYGVAASGEQLRDVTIMLGKAMDDPARGMTALRRRGIQFTDQQENMIKTMQQVEGREKAQAYLLKEINILYGGTNAALAQTDKGMEIVAKNAIGDSMEELGKILVPLKQSLITIALQILPYVNQGLAMIPAILDYAIPLVKAFVIAWAAYKVLKVGSSIFDAVSGIIQLRGSIGPAIKQMGLLTFITGNATASQWSLNAAIAANPFGLIATAIALAVMYLIWLNNNLEEAKRLFMDITSVLDKPWVQGLLSLIPGMNTAVALRQQIKQQQPPNQTAVESNRQNVDVSGQINVSAPEGTQVKKSSKSAPGVNWNMMGPNEPIGGFGSY